MKTRANKEQIAAFIAANPSIELVSHKSGWANLKGDDIDSLWQAFIDSETPDIPGFGESKLNLERISSDLADEMNGEASTEISSGDSSDEPQPEYREQLGYKKEVELLPADEYCIKVVCECGEIRWVKTSDEFQVFACKPCTIRQRRQRAAQRRKEKRQRIKAMEAQASTQEWEDTNAELMAEAQ